MKISEQSVDIELVSTKGDIARIKDHLEKFGDVAYALVNHKRGMSLISKSGATLNIPALKCRNGAYVAYLIARTLELASFGEATNFWPDVLFKDTLTITRTEAGVRLQSERLIG